MKVASKIRRLLNMILDLFISYILYFIFLLVLGMFAARFNLIDSYEMQPTTFVQISIYTSFLIFYLFYVFLLEALYQKTIGKFFTKTKVVNLIGENPNVKQIFIRTICRLIPFEMISFLGKGNGIHDILSKTMVVND